ncbi:tetratricopeptide repeat protein [Trichocoleus sp. FACHB-90]|nr:tetratricopeptide repeat protein [Trichocoleus sp. FACHB-90]
MADAQLLGENVSEQDLRQLARRSLLQEERDNNGGRWFQFHPFILAYVKQKGGDLTEAHQKAIAYYRENAKSQPWQTISDIAEYLEVFYHSYQRGEYDDTFNTIRLCDDFLTLRGYNTVRVELYGQLVEAWQQNNSDSWEFAASLTTLSNAYNSLGQYQLAIDYYQQSLAIFREIGDRNGEAASLNNLGNAYNSLGQYQLAIDYYQQSLAIKREIGDRNGEAASLIGLGNAYRSLGQYPLAIDYHQQSLAIKREIGDRNGEAASLIGLGNAYRSLGQYPLAIDYHQQSLAIKREIGDRNGEAASLGNLGNAYNSLGQYPLAIDYLQQSLAIFGEISDRNGEADSLGNLGSAYYSLGQYPLAIDYLQQSLAIFREIGDRKGEANSLFNLGNALAKQDLKWDAIRSYKNARYLYQEIGLSAKVENCDAAIQNVGKVIATTPIRAPEIGAKRESIPVVPEVTMRQRLRKRNKSIFRQNWIQAIIGFVRRWVQWLWQIVCQNQRRR